MTDIASVEYYDTDGDGYVDTVVADTDGDGYVDAVSVDVNGDGYGDIAVGSTAGGLLGAQVGRRLSRDRLRVVIVLVGLAAILELVL